ncbi:HlyD family efflux transporter periplasmic adaptor subunit [Rhodococcus koreensis]
MVQDTTAVAVNLQLRPAQSVDLCYPIDGIIGDMPSDILGRSVKGIDLAGTVYPTLSDTAPPDPSLLLMDSANIHNSVSASVIATLRSEPIKADLDSAIGMRQNAYYTTYSPKVVNRVVNRFHGDEGLLVQLHALLRKHIVMQEKLKEAYSAAGFNDVVQEATTTTTDTHTTSTSKVTSEQLKTPPGGTGPQNYSPSGARQVGSGTSDATSSSESLGIEFRFPSLENDALHQRRIVDLLPENLAAFRMSEMCEHWQVTFANELRSIDLQIRKLQSAYLDTILMSPFDGVVTGLFRQKGDYVTAGQPVARVENDANVYLVGTIKYRFLIKIGYKVSVHTILFDQTTAGATQSTISGKVVAVRGHDSIAEQWDVLIRCPNTTGPAGATLFPMNYNFESHNAEVEITPA